MVFATSIQSFAGAHTLQSSGNTNCAPDWRNGAIWIGATSANLSKSVISSGAESGYSALASFNDPTNHITAACPPICTDSNGVVYLNTGVGVSRINSTTITRYDTWGAWSGGIFPPGLPDTTTNDGSPTGQLVNLSTAATQYTLALGPGGIFASLNNAYLLNLPNFAGLTWEWSGNNAVGVGGKNGTGVAFLASGSAAGSYTVPVTVYKVVVTDGSWVPADWPTPNPNANKSTLATINPTDVDAGWTEIYISAGCLDQTDGNPIFQLYSSSGASPYTYLVKINATSGAIVWKCSLIGKTLAGKQFERSRVDHQKLYFLVANLSGSPPNTVVTVDTSVGTSSSYTTGLAGLTFFGAQSSDDESGAVVCSLGYVAGVGSPTPRHSTSSPFTGWAALYVAESIGPPPASAGRKFLAELGPVKI